MKIVATAACRPLVLVALLAACSLAALADEKPRANAYTQPHVLRFSDAEDISTLNPVLSNEQSPQLLGRLAMAWLVRYDRSNRAEPELATVVPSRRNGGISRDGKTITYHLRKGVRWSDGRPFDASFESTFFGTGGGNPCLLPKRLLGGLASINQAAYNDLPVGIGPFRFDLVDFHPNSLTWFNYMMGVDI